MILDELPTLHQLPSLRPGLAESRQFGGCFVLGVQVFSALRELYGRDGAETISGLCGTRVVLAAPDKDTSEWSAESLGRVEVESLSEGVSYETPRDGVTLSARRDLRSLVLPAEVARLENLSGYLKFPGAWPVAWIGLKYRKRSRVAERFVPKAEGDGGGIGQRSTTEEPAGGDESAAAEAGQHHTPCAMKAPDGGAAAATAAGPACGSAHEAQEGKADAGKGAGKRADEPGRRMPGSGEQTLAGLDLPAPSAACGDPREKKAASAAAGKDEGGETGRGSGHRASNWQ